MPAVNSEDVEAKVFAKLDAWGFTPGDKLAVAFSGGGDSTALLSLLIKWNKSGKVFAFIVDHALRGGSGKEAKLAEKRALAMGAQTKILTCQWPDGVPKTGIQEKARNARYQLLGDVCRESGIENLFLGHNLDDQAETVLMRQQAGSGWRGMSGMKGVSRAPIWPSLCGVNVVRPLLDCSREKLRLYNKNNSLKWIDDPSNANRSFARIRAREHLAAHDNEKQNLRITAKAAGEVLALEQEKIAHFIKDNTELHDCIGMMILPPFHQVTLGKSAEALKYLLPAVSGQSLSPAYDKRMNLAHALRRPDFSGATLGGVRFVPTNSGVLCVRDLGGLLGRHGVGAIETMHLNEHYPRIWDGRFLLSSPSGAVSVEALANHLDDLSSIQKKRLNRIPEPARGGLPVLLKGNQIVHSPFVNKPTRESDLAITCLIKIRLYSLLGELFR